MSESDTCATQNSGSGLSISISFCRLASISDLMSPLSSEITSPFSSTSFLLLHFSYCFLSSSNVVSSFSRLDIHCLSLRLASSLARKPFLRLLASDRHPLLLSMKQTAGNMSLRFKSSVKGTICLFTNSHWPSCPSISSLLTKQASDSVDKLTRTVC